MEWFVDVLAWHFMRRAFVALVLAGIAFPLLGVLVVQFNLQVIRFALMHVGLLGGAAALVAGCDPLLGGLGSVALASFLLGPMGDRSKVNIPAVAGLMMTGSLALAFIVFYRTGIPAMEAFNLLSGSVLMLQRRDLVLTFVLALGTILVVVRWYRDIQIILFDQSLAEILGVPEKAIRYALLTLIGLAVAVAMRLVGALLADALLLLPATAALRIGKNLRAAFLWSSCLGLATAVGGVCVSVAGDLPVGASVAITGVVVVALAYLLHWFVKTHEKGMR